ncbi:hypothetical protein CFAM422_010806 [Trichoderma lentiforme]|uniref:Uncharacterized protein n=1 Tax=Trichoderma lentiforme TaxID=1567552 RepID=A0A9P4X725_9HYPO|nr:hypothetical protein CFAM422_010806 [Trichoderma lentiforme]
MPQAPTNEAAEVQEVAETAEVTDHNTTVERPRQSTQNKQRLNYKTLDGGNRRKRAGITIHEEIRYREEDQILEEKKRLLVFTTIKVIQQLNKRSSLPRNWHETKKKSDYHQR